MGCTQVALLPSVKRSGIEWPLCSCEITVFFCVTVKTKIEKYNHSALEKSCAACDNTHFTPVAKALTDIYTHSRSELVGFRSEMGMYSSEMLPSKSAVKFPLMPPCLGTKTRTVFSFLFLVNSTCSSKIIARIGWSYFIIAWRDERESDRMKKYFFPENSKLCDWELKG